MKFCPNCGKQITSPAKFCSGCGYKLEMPPQQPPVYAPPVQQPPVYAPPVQQPPVYTPPVQQPPVYAPPVQQPPVYTPPVQQSPVYTPPVQEAPVYTPPVQEAPVYTPPVQEAPVYTPPVQEAPVYTPPVQEAPVYNPPIPKAPAQPKPDKAVSGKKKSKVLLFVLIGVAVLAIGAIAAILLLGGGNDSPLGVYNAVSMMGFPVSGDEAWIELKDGGKFTIDMMGDQEHGTWTQDGNKVSLTIDGETVTGTLKGGKLELSMDGVSLIFQKADSKSDGKPGAESTAPQAAASESGYWTLLRLDNDDPDYALDESIVNTMRDLGAEIFLNLEADGTGTASLGVDSYVQWGDGQLTLTTSNMKGSYTFTGDQLKFVLNGDDSTYIFVRGTGNPPAIEIGSSNEPVDVPPTTQAPEVEVPTTQAPTEVNPVANYDWWDGEWYGWWVLVDAYGGYTDYVGNCWDACAIIEVDDAEGIMTLWDPDYSYDEPMIYAELEFDEGWGELGSFVSLEGYFMDADLGYYDWYCDPYTCEVSHFEDMFCFTGEYEDPADPGSGFTYMVVLRPWGMEWEDVRYGDTSNCTFDDMMPPTYDSWYLPLIKAGIKHIPLTFAEGEELLAK